MLLLNSSDWIKTFCTTVKNTSEFASLSIFLFVRSCLAPTENAQTGKVKNGRWRWSVFFVLQMPALLLTCQWLMWTGGGDVAGWGRGWVIAGLPIKSLDGENSWTSSTICSVFPL